MKKYNIKDPELFSILVNKQLEKYHVTVDDILKDKRFIRPKYTLWYKFLLKIGFKKPFVEWFRYYTFDTPEEFENWKNFCINFLTTRTMPKMSKKQAETAFAWLNLDVGLKQSYLYENS